MLVQHVSPLHVQCCRCQRHGTRAGASLSTRNRHWCLQGECYIHTPLLHSHSITVTYMCYGLWYNRLMWFASDRILCAVVLRWLYFFHHPRHQNLKFIKHQEKGHWSYDIHNLTQYLHTNVCYRDTYPQIGAFLLSRWPINDILHTLTQRSSHFWWQKELSFRVSSHTNLAMVRSLWIDTSFSVISVVGVWSSCDLGFYCVHAEEKGSKEKGVAFALLVESGESWATAGFMASCRIT